MAHSRKILSQAGTSLADVYDVEGSVVGLEELDVANIQGVHELGHQIHAERLLVFGLIANTGALAQSTAWDVSLSAFPDSINRLLSISAVSSFAGRVNDCSVHIGDPLTGVDHGIWLWDSVNDVEGTVRRGSPAVAAAVSLRPLSHVAGGLPTLLARTGTSGRMPNLIFRGSTSAFGAGTVTVQALMQVIRPDRGAPGAGEPSSHGLPIPSW